MPRKARRVQADSERMRNRALWCRQLADGAADLQFSIKLNALSEEYESGAVARMGTEASPGGGHADEAKVERPSTTQQCQSRTR